MRMLILALGRVTACPAAGMCREPGTTAQQPPDDLFRAVKRSSQDPALAMERVKALGEQGAQVNVSARRDTKSGRGLTALEAARAASHPGIVEYPEAVGRQVK